MILTHDLSLMRLVRYPIVLDLDFLTFLNQTFSQTNVIYHKMPFFKGIIQVKEGAVVATQR